ncbi:hypothetical protein F5B22DRAFT_598611 [Xylaria bambusicola]|uniref:uncharacterized protein n=1 Tax=Xylaria bambusicola TaxID=326684 RepID=UPI002008A22E|nr:uncharacterized protein F5B22DRAFT_598611 [Xylaria bambusicola]KAI0520851.1 hypothetical protein F5B22DRAFT_598611 [Xylaria bambusicola]
MSIWLAYFMSFYTITAIFVFFLTRPTWFDEESPEEHTHIGTGFLCEKLSQELGWDNELAPREFRRPEPEGGA